MARKSRHLPSRRDPKPLVHFASGETFVLIFRDGVIKGSEDAAGDAIDRWREDGRLPFGSKDAAAMRRKVRGAAEYEGLK